MPVELQACLLDSLKEEFLEGVNGDITLKFIHDGNVVETRKCHSCLINKVEYFAAQSNFAEGGAKEFSIDIGSFYEGCKIGFKKFIEATFIVLFGGDAIRDFELDSDFGSKYSVIRLREYLGFSYHDLCKSDILSIAGAAKADDVKENREAMLFMLRVCTEELAEAIVRSDAIKLKIRADTWTEKWERVYSIAQELREDGRLTQNGKVLSRWLCKRYHNDLDGPGWFSDDILECISFHFEAGYDMSRYIEDDDDVEFLFHSREHFKSWSEIVIEETSNFFDLPANEFIDSLKCDGETTIFDLQAMAFLLSNVVRPVVDQIFDEKRMFQPKDPPAATTNRRRSELRDQMRQEQIANNHIVEDLHHQAVDIISHKLHRVHTELASRVMKLTDANADLTKRLERLEDAKEQNTATGSKRRREE